MPYDPSQSERAVETGVRVQFSEFVRWNWRREVHSDPCFLPAARAKHAENASRQQKELSAWKAANPVTPNPQAFTEEIWPRIREVTVAALVAATGLSQSMCKSVRSGELVPHPRHWDKFRAAARAKQTR